MSGATVRAADVPTASAPAADASTPTSEDTALVIRVVKGKATALDIAALTTVLLARAAALAATGPGLQEGKPAAGWRPRPDHRGTAHRDPRGWQVSGGRAA
ncbi:acyl-CoA carboxylase epsilon subunit [Streptomyces sp. A1136]|uniref:acyl-CoA carboxylase epsilon subunit n=1 Tax=Streptomyces sp. A1136 TaxID=2563102 RepID=UPI001F0D0056|nr:acyl-CoA carboxylase epsilon subunit [Streptomyces sp. A1136]